MTSLTLDTHLGAVDALEVGPRSRQVDLVLCIQGKSPNTDVVTEWHPLARLLQDKSIRVVVPNLHSNERTRPGTISQEDFDRFVLGALTQLKVKTLLCLCGKSWGGGRCVAFLAEHPSAATSLMLIAPSLKETTAGMVSDVAQKRTLLAWAWDDTVVPIAAAQPLLDSATAELQAVLSRFEPYRGTESFNGFTGNLIRVAERAATSPVPQRADSPHGSAVEDVRNLNGFTITAIWSISM